MPIKKKTAKTTSISWRNVLVVSLAVIVGVAVAAQICFDRYLLREMHSGQPHIRTLLADALVALNRPAVVDGPTGKVYLSEAKLVLPAYTPTVTDLLYAYTPPMDGTKEELTLTTRSATARTVGAIKNTPNLDDALERLSEAQACNRQFRLTFAADDSWTYYEESFTKQLQDGRTLHAYIAKDCKVGSEGLREYLRDIESYSR
jgi:hypothetical protein